MLGDVSKGNFRPIVTTTFRDLIFQKFSSLSHGGAKATIKLITERHACMHACITET